MLRARLKEKFGNPDVARIKSRKKWFYVFSVYSFVLYLVHEIMFGSMFLPEFYFQGTQVEQEFFTTNFFVVQIMILCSITAFVCMRFKREYVASCFQTVAGIAGMVNMIQILFGEYNNQSYMFVAYLIAWIGSLIAFSILLIYIKQKRKFKAAVTKEYEKIYNRYRDDEETMFTEEQLEMILIAYETAMKNKTAPPKTLAEIIDVADQTKDGE